jgi:hypothetical protein
MARHRCGVMHRTTCVYMYMRTGSCTVVLVDAGCRHATFALLGSYSWQRAIGDSTLILASGAYITCLLASGAQRLCTLSSSVNACGRMLRACRLWNLANYKLPSLGILLRRHRVINRSSNVSEVDHCSLVEAFTASHCHATRICICASSGTK